LLERGQDFQSASVKMGPFDSQDPSAMTSSDFRVLKTTVQHEEREQKLYICLI